MKDSVTGDSIVVSTDGDAGPYIIVPKDKRDAVRSILDANGHPYTIDEDAVTSGDGHSDSVFNLGDGADTDTIQQNLDDAD